MESPSRIGYRIAAPTVVAAAFGLAGCGAGGLPSTADGAGTAARSGVEHAMSGIAYKTYPAGLDRVHGAVLGSMGRMGIIVRKDVATGFGRRIVAAAAARQIEVELERLADGATRMRVEAGQGSLLNDRATASEIVIQTGIALGERTESDKAGAKAG